MTFFRRIHRLPLSRFVDFFWLAEGYVQPHAAERVLPTGCVDLILSLDEHHKADVVAGVRSRSIVIDTSRPLSLIGVRFRHGGAGPFLGLPVGELQDRPFISLPRKRDFVASSGSFARSTQLTGPTWPSGAGTSTSPISFTISGHSRA